MTVVLHNAATGELVVTAHAADWGEGWTVVADPAPADIETAPYLLAGGVLVPDLAAARATQRAIINAARDAAQHGGAVTSFGTFDTSQRSLLFLNGAVSAAQAALAASASYYVDWTRADDTVATLDAMDTITAGLEVAAHIDTIHQRARVLKQRIDDATTLAAIAAVVWTLED